MALDKTYWEAEAERRIEAAKRTGATRLDLSNIKLTVVPEAIASLTQLRWLDLSSNQLTVVPEMIASLTQLQTLDLSDNKLTAVPEAIAALTQLQTLYLSTNKLTALPEAIASLTQLQELHLSRNQLTALPEAIASLTQLQTLKLSGNQLTALPEAIASLTQLQTLKLSGNQLTALPEAIASLTQLQTLKLSGNQLTALPEAIASLTQLQTLKLSGNQLTALPEAIAALTQLQTLKLSGNQLTALPEAIASLAQLQSLHLYENELTALPEAIAALTQLQSLDLSRNQLKAVPEAIASLAQLRLLHLFGNELTAVPEAIASLTQLQILDLSSNELTAVPEAIASLTQLQILDLSFNELTEVPEAIAALTQLQRLDLSRNRLTEVPEAIASLSQLQRLDLDYNPLNPELAAAYKEGLTAVKAYLRAKAEAQIVLNEAKLILVGEGEVGKTSLLGAMRGDEWVENRQTTDGVEVDIKSLVVTDSESGKEITLNAWDFGGQPIYRHTHQLFFTAPAIYLAVWNPRRGPEQCCVGEWLKMVKHRACDETRPDEQPHILVVATHGGPKQRLDHIDEKTLQDEFGNLIVGFYHIDSKTGYGLDDLKQVIAHQAANIPQVGRSVPASWKRVLDALRQRSQTDAWITYEQFQTLCAAQDVDLELAKLYAIVLNELGHLIHDNTDPVLKDTVILKPEWLSKAISFVLEDDQAEKQNGLVTHKHLSELWDDPARGEDRYPGHLHPVFRKLMERCDLSYQVELPEADAPPTTLMAQLVPGSRTDGWEQDWILQSGDTERTQICRILDAQTGRTVEAEGLMYRLIVRLHRYSLGRKNYYLSRHWKNGMLLDDGFNGRALIEEIAGDVYITVRAAYPTGFLGHLCAEVSWLVKNFWKGLDPRQYLPCPTPDCKGLLERDEIIDFKNQGMSKVRCAVCRNFHNIDDLMAPNAAKPEWQDAVKQLHQGQQQIFRAVDQGFDSVSVQLRTLMSQADEQYRALLTTLTDPAKDGPRLFSIQPVDPGFFDKPKYIAQKFHLTLWCEHSRLPLTAINGKDDKRGVYEIELTKEWIQKISPLLRIISITLKLALPIAIPGTKLATDDREYKAIMEQLEFGVQTANSFVQGSENIGNWLVDGETSDFETTTEKTKSRIRAKGSLLRELHAILQKQDPTNNFGGLEKVQNKRQEFLWIHPKYLDQY